MFLLGIQNSELYRLTNWNPSIMRKKRIVYMNDARHYYLFVFEPPMTMEEAWTPIDEVAGTAVDTFCYGVERGDGLFYPSRVGMRFGADIQPFDLAAYWRTWHNMQSLIDRGLDPLQVLIDRAHEKNMDFFASLRMPHHGGQNPAHRLENGGRALGHQELRDHQLTVLEELATEYATDGLELDFALPGGSHNIRKEDAQEMIPVLTEYVEQIAEMVKSKRGADFPIGVRVLPTEALNLAEGLDVRTWLQKGLIDFVIPMQYLYMILDPNMPVDWLIDAAHDADVSVYGMLHPYVADTITGAQDRVYPTPAQLRAAVANNWARGVDGLYAWFMRWPLGDEERSSLSEWGDQDLIKKGDKHYVLACNLEAEKDDSHYPTSLPVEIAPSDTGTKHTIPFYIADDITNNRDRIQQIRLRMNIIDLVSADRIDILLNGESLKHEICLRSYGSNIVPYASQRLEFQLKDTWPVQGDNRLDVVLEKRVEGLVSPLKIDQLEVLISYAPFPSGLG
jgi:hypothetical protein